MAFHPFLIIGGGLAGHAAASAIRELEPDAPITMLGEEKHRPYSRPPLSKGLWTGKSEDSIWLPEVAGLELLSGCSARVLDPAAHEVTDSTGAKHGYDQLLLATGGSPRRLGEADEQVIYYRTLDDFRHLRDGGAEHVLVVGGGFVGTEIAAGLVQSGRKVTLLFPEAGIGARLYPPGLAASLEALYRDKGVQIIPGAKVAHLQRSGARTKAVTTTRREILADAIVAGLGLEPNVQLATAAGLHVAGGIVVDKELRTSAPDVFAAGDVAALKDDDGQYRRIEHEDHATSSGRAAGRAMVGAGEPYHHVSFFYSDLFEVGYEAVGHIDARLETAAAWKTENREGIVYYLEGGRVRGVLTLGLFGQVDAARALLGREVRELGPLRASLA
jgi:3-phenylpropionate/trans-cinnamate dioxygenase ferredoxin reductase subunit